MSPYDIDPKINYRRLGELADELTQFLTHLEALYLDAVAGFAFVRSRVVAEQDAVRKLVAGTEADTPEIQDGRMFTYDMILAKHFCGSAFHRATLGEVKARNYPGGSNYKTLGNLCIVALYDYWNDHLRREYVIEKGKLDANETNPEIVQRQLREHASYDFWGDLGNIRNAIVHNRGIATSKVANCKLIRWFQLGDPIDINPPRLNAILLAAYQCRTGLGIEQFPEQYIEIPVMKKPGSNPT